MEEIYLLKTFKKIMISLGNAALFLINYTIIFIPFFLFIKLSDGNDLSTALPFVLFYCLRLTGVSLFRSIKTTVNSLNLLVLALLLGFSGSVLTVLGRFYFPLYILASIFLGLAASWVMPAGISVNYYEAQKKWHTKTNYPLVLLLLSLLLLIFHLVKNPFHGMLFYALFFLLGIFAVSHYPSYDLKAPKEASAVSKREFIAFLAFFILLFFLRAGRLLANSTFFDYGTIGASLLFLIFTLFGSRLLKHIPYQTSLYLRLLTYLDGFISNYLFLFGSIYVIGLFGEKDLPLKIFLPFFLGMILGMLTGPKIKNRWGLHLKKRSLIAIILSLFLILTNTSITFGIFFVSFFRTLFNSSITDTFYQLENIPQDKRILAKFTLQNRGSMLHQFILMGIILFLSKFDKTSIMMFLTLDATKSATPQIIKFLHQANYIASSLIILLILTSFVMERHLAINSA